MSILEVETFCGCFSLRTGSLIIGYMQLISNLISGIAIFATLVHPVGMLLIIAAVFNLHLVYGVHKNKSSYVRVYFLYSAMMLMLVLFDNSPDLDFNFTKEITLLIYMYFLLVIKSYYYRMVEETLITEKTLPQ